MTRRRTAADPVRLAHLTTIDLSLHALLATELRIEADAGLHVLGSPRPAHRAAIEALGVEVVDVARLTRRWSLPTDLAAVVELWRLLPTLDLDVLHTHTPKAGVFGRVVGRLRRVPVVVHTCHGLLATPDDRLRKRVVVYAIEGIAARFSHAELFQNADDQRALRFAVPPSRSTLVGNGVDLERFRFDPEGRAKVRAELGVADDELLVGGVGRRVAEKGLFEFAAAARALAPQRPVRVGRPRRARQGRRRGRRARRRGAGRARDDMTAMYSALDVFVLPSYREGFHGRAMEAAACGRPVVLSDIRGCREIGRDGVEVSFVPPRDAAALTAGARPPARRPRAACAPGRRGPRARPGPLRPARRRRARRSAPTGQWRRAGGWRGPRGHRPPDLGAQVGAQRRGRARQRDQPDHTLDLCVGERAAARKAEALLEQAGADGPADARRLGEHGLQVHRLPDRPGLDAVGRRGGRSRRRGRRRARGVEREWR